MVRLLTPCLSMASVFSPTSGGGILALGVTPSRSGSFWTEDPVLHLVPSHRGPHTQVGAWPPSQRKRANVCHPVALELGHKLGVLTGAGEPSGDGDKPEDSRQLRALISSFGE